MARFKRNDVTDVIRFHWNARASTFDRELGHGVHSEGQRQAWLELLGRLAGPRPRRVLDVGCGTGVLALMFAELGHVVSGIDLAPQMLDVAREKAEREKLNIDFRVENAASLGLADDTYDLVIARHVIWTLPDPARAVTEWMRVLRPGGRLALIEGKWADNEAIPRLPLTPKAMLGAIKDATLGRVYSSLGRQYGKLYVEKYRQIESELPFSGGPPAERLVAFLSAHGVANVSLEPLMSRELWEETPRFPRYLVVGNR
ncbi:MAG: class I SAM-dependent methyltransferase [Candidatus Velthaea sp.]